jgi:hypothetical protein
MEGILAAPSSDGRRPGGQVAEEVRPPPAHPVVVLRTREQERKERGDGPVHGTT